MPAVFDIVFDFPTPHPPAGKLLRQFSRYLQNTGWRYQFCYHTFVKPNTVYDIHTEIIKDPPRKLIPLMERDIIAWEKRQRKLLAYPAYEMVWLHPQWPVRDRCRELRDDDFHDACENWLKLVYDVAHSISTGKYSFSISFWLNESFWLNQNYNVEKERFDAFVQWLFPLILETKATGVAAIGELAPIFLPVADDENAEYHLGEFYIEPAGKAPFAPKIMNQYYGHRQLNPDFTLWVRRDLF